MSVEAVIFDWGGTLSEFADVDMADMWRLAARHLSPAHEDELCRRLVLVEQSFWQRTATDQQSFRLGDLLAAASREVGLDITDAVLEEAGTQHLDSWTPHIRHDPDAIPTLRALRDRGLRTGLLSNTHWPRSFHEHFLERDGLGELIDARCYTSEMAVTKPHGDAFRQAMDAIGVDEPSGVVFVGDRPFDDVWGAKQAGMRGVLRPNDLVPAYDVVPDAVIERLPELLDLVDAWG